MNKNIEDLIKITKENPDLPIIPIVDSTIVADGAYSWWMGSFGKVFVDEYFSTEDGVFLKSKEKMEDAIYFFYGCDIDDFEEDIEEVYNKIKWKKTIIVSIELPDMNKGE